MSIKEFGQGMATQRIVPGPGSANGYLDPEAEERLYGSGVRLSGCKIGKIWIWV